jgi:DNA-binding CsgD family transcriptional regulator
MVFEPVALRSVLPPGLEQADDGAGFALFYLSDSSNLFPPSSAFYVGVFLKGRDAPDGSPGIFVAQGYYSNAANLEVSRAYSLRFDTGWADIDVCDDVITARGGPLGSTAVEFVLRRLNDQLPLTMGTHQYYGERAGGLTTYSLAFAARLFPCSTAAVDIRPDAPPVLQQLTPLRVTGASYVSGAPLHFSRPRAVASTEIVTASDAAHSAILQVLSDLGKAAAVVAEDGSVLSITTQGRRTLTPLLRGERVQASTHVDQQKLMNLIGEAAHARGDGTPRRLVLHPSPEETLIVQAANYRGGWQGTPCALLLLSSTASTTNTALDLTLLGLTPAESRIATEMANGRTARETAAVLGLKENTVRSSLKVVYDKLNVTNKAELANLVSELR